MSTLVRKSLPESIPDIFDAADAEFAKQVQNKLGYDQYQRAIAAQRTSNAAEVLAAVRALDDAPFDPASVARYKKRKARQEWAKSYWSVFNDCYWWIFAAVALLGVGMFVMGCVVCSAWGTACWWFFGPAITCGVGLIAIAICGGELHDRSFRSRSATWRCSRLNGYSGVVPAHALGTALAIVEACPSARLFVDELVVRDAEWQEPVVRDPFLVVEDNCGHAYFLVVWEEPHFKKVQKVV